MQPTITTPTLVKIKIDEIELLEKNPRKISKRDFKALCDDIRKDPAFLIQRPPLINNTNRKLICYAGNQRIKAAKECGYSEIQCWVEENVSEELQNERMLKDNLHRGEWDFSMLADFDPSFLNQVGFQFDQLSDFYKDKDKVHNDNFNVKEEIVLIKKSTIKPGEIYQLGDHRLMCGDSSDIHQVETLMENEQANNIYCDPPYNIGLSYDKGVKPQTIKKRYTESVFSDSKPNRKYVTWLMGIVSNAVSVSNQNAHVFFWCDPKFIGLVQDAFRVNGIANKSVCFWVKNSFNPVTNMAFNRLVEPVVYGTIGRAPINDSYKSLAEVLNPEMTGRKIFETFMEIFDVWTVSRDHVNDYNHPTQKPVTLHEKPLKRCTAVGDIVLDLFGGSGSTLIACEQMERKSRLMEMDPTFCQLIINRFEKFSGKKAVKVN